MRLKKIEIDIKGPTPLQHHHSVQLLAMSAISLRHFGYNMASNTISRHSALVKAIVKHGVLAVIARLEQVKINSRYSEQTEADIKFITPIDDDEDEEDDDDDFVAQNKEVVAPKEEVLECKERNNTVVSNDEFIECMGTLNEKLCQATLDKDVVMINLIVSSMTNVIKSSL